MATSTYRLEHFYYGQAVNGGKPEKKPGLLAASSGVTDKLAQAALGRVTLPPHIRSGIGSWAVVRGRSRQFPYLLLQSQVGDAGQTVTHYVIVPTDFLKAVAGNLRVLRRLLEDKLPTFNETGGTLPPVEIEPPTDPVSTEDQVDQILELMTITRNKTATIERLLAAIVQGVQIVIQGAPDGMDARIDFVQGLLALLPMSVRHSVTFTTHSLPQDHIDARIRFYGDDSPPEGTVVFNWKTGQVFGEDVHHDYTHYVISQLRLDAGLVIQRNRSMASIAGWRLNQGDRLADALAYASNRLKVDTALQENQPVSKDEVARILSEDPTLSPELQVLYADHLVRFSLAMEDMRHAAPVAVLLGESDTLERNVRDMMEKALSDGMAWLLYDTLLEWMRNPLGPQTPEWVELTHRATLTYLQERVKARDYETILAVLAELQKAGAVLNPEALVPKVIKLLLPQGGTDARISANLFLLGVRYLPDEPFRQLMNVERFRDQLDPQIARAWTYATEQTNTPVDPESLVNSARRYGEAWEPIILLRLTEAAITSGRADALSASTLKALVDLALSSEGGEYRDRLRRVASSLERGFLGQLQGAAPRYVLGLRLALGDYDRLAQGMLQQLRQLYPADEQDAYLGMIAKLFAETQVPVDDVPVMLQAISNAGVRSVPYLVAAMSTVQNHLGKPDIDSMAAEALELLNQESHLIDTVPSQAVLGLLKHFTVRKDLDSMQKIAGLAPRAIAYLGKRGVRIIADIYKSMGWDARAQEVGLQILRVYVRQQDSDMARKVTNYFVKELDASVQRPLELTSTIHDVMGNMDIADYAESVNTAAVLLYHVMELYVSRDRIPATSDIYNGLSALPGAGGITQDREKALLDGLMTLGRSIVALGKQYRQARSRSSEDYISTVVAGEKEPSNTLDLMRIMSGGLANGHRFAIQVTPPRNRYPLNDYSFGELIDDVEASASVIGSAAKALPLNKPPSVTAKEVRQEMNSIQASVSLNLKHMMLHDVARDLQYLIDLIVMIFEASDPKAFENGGLARKIESGKHRPRSPLEFLRFIHGYYHARSE